MGDAPGDLMLTRDELDLALDTRIFHLKDQVLRKIRGLLEQTARELSELNSALPAGVLAGTPKISRGENYRLMPYLVLDFPRYAEGENLYLFRTMFWWGHYFISSLIVSGNPLNQTRTRAGQQCRSLSWREDLLFCVAATPWHHDAGPDNLRSFASLGAKALDERLQEQEFVKLSRILPLDRSGHLPQFSVECFQLFNGIFTP
jgi:hypothetical protein